MFEWWKFLLYMFMEKESFLDVGCATGLLERGFVKACETFGLMGKTIEGFDHSSWAIKNADENVKNMLKRASVNDYVFGRRFDVMLMLDVLEHLTESQARDWLNRSREHINDCVFAVIALDEPHHWGDESHINLQNREWWDNLFIETGWRKNKKGEIFENEYSIMTELAMEHKFIKANKLQIFIYGANDV